MTCLNYRSNYMFMGRRGEKEPICALHAIDTEFLARRVIQADKGPIDFVTHGIMRCTRGYSGAQPLEAVSGGCRCGSHFGGTP